MVPNAEEVADVFGPCSTGVFKALNVSARKRIFNCSLIWKVLFAEKSSRRCFTDHRLGGFSQCNEHREWGFISLDHAAQVATRQA